MSLPTNKQTSKTKTNFFKDPLVLTQIFFALAALWINSFEDYVSLSLIRLGQFVQPKALSAMCLAVLIFLQGIYFLKLDKKKTAMFFLVLGLIIFVINLTQLLTTLY